MMKRSGNRLSNQVAIVTGAGQGMGAAMAKLIAEEGGQVVVSDINQEKASVIADEISETETQALAIRADVTREKTFRRWLRQRSNIMERSAFWSIMPGSTALKAQQTALIGYSGFRR